MFEKTRYRLTIAYLSVLTIILMSFSLSVRYIFLLSLNQQFNSRLEGLAKAASFNMDFEDGELEVDDEENLVQEQQTIQWFNLENNLVIQQGKYNLDFPLKIAPPFQNFLYPEPIRSFTQPVYDPENNELIGYVRVGESLRRLQNTLRRLDYGLTGGVIIAVLLSAIGGIWLTHQAMKPIEKSFERLKQFTADASHELRSPLMAIKTNADVALKYSEGIRKTDEEKFNAIASATNQITCLTENLLLLARTDTVAKIKYKTINLSLLLSDLAKSHQPKAQAKNLVLVTQIAQDLLSPGDEILLRQLFTNLLQNALYYTLSGGSVKIEADKVHSKFIDIKVKDTGIGIALENLDRIFERFWRVDKSRSYQAGKSGLGLAIAREIAQVHKGKISVESQLGVGSCFTVRLLSRKAQ